jgi:predicted O-methyltransferase YrrM
MTTDQLTLDEILEIGSGYWKSKALLCAVGFDLFSFLDNGAADMQKISTDLGLHPKGLRDLLDALVAMKILQRNGNGDDAAYLNSPASAQYLSKKSPNYMGGILDMWNTRSYKIWGNLDAAIRTGDAQSEIKMFKLHAMPARLQAFSNSMEQISRINFEQLTKVFDFSGHKCACDIGGASGLFSVMLAQAVPQLQCISFDFPSMGKIATENIARHGLDERIKVVSGDFSVDQVPAADLYTMSMVLHGLDVAQKLHLIRMVYDAMPANGVLIAIDNLIDDERRENTIGMLMSLNMLLELGGAAEFSYAEFQRWCGEVGFQGFAKLRLSQNYSAAIAFKNAADADKYRA